MAYTNEKTQEVRVNSKIIIKDYLKDLQAILKLNGIDAKFIKSPSDYIDFVIEAKKIAFVFRLTTSQHKIGLSNNAKYWKVRSDLKGITKNFRTKKNPHTYVPSIYKKQLSSSINTDEVKFIYPVLHPYNKSVYDKDLYFIGSFEDSIKFIIRSLK